MGTNQENRNRCIHETEGLHRERMAPQRSAAAAAEDSPTLESPTGGERPEANTACPVGADVTKDVQLWLVVLHESDRGGEIF